MPSPGKQLKVVGLQIVSPLHLQLPYPWIQPIVDGKYSGEKIIFLLQIYTM